jgi:hypothetical protein
VRHQYRVTHVVTTDYGDGPATGTHALAHLAIIPDGSHWQDRPQTLTQRVPIGTQPGAVIEVSIGRVA